MPDLTGLPDADLPDARKAVVRSALVSEIRAPRRVPGRTPLAIGLGTALVLAGAGGAAAWLTAGPAADPTVAWCYPNQEIERGDDWGGTQVTYVSREGTSAIPSVVDACAAAWRVGAVRAQLGDEGTVPPLVACLLPRTQEAAVLPASSCESLGLPRLVEPQETP
jgi:hypothetical protein